MSGRREVLGVVELGLAVAVVVAAGEQVDGAVVVDRADDVVEVDGAVEEVPRTVALQGPQEVVDAQHVAARRPRDVGEVLVTAEREPAERELPVAELVGLGRLHRRIRPDQSLDLPFARLMTGRCRPSARWCRRRDTSAAAGPTAAPPRSGRPSPRQQRHVAATGCGRAHLRAVRFAVDGDRPVLAGRGQRRGQLDQADGHVAVHAQHRLVVVARPPARRALGTDRLDDVLLVLADGDLLVRRRHAGDLEHVGERVVLGVVVDDLDRALAVVVERTEDRSCTPPCAPTLSTRQSLDGPAFGLRTIVRRENTSQVSDECQFTLT